jgi:uncharacterized protein YukE
MSDSLGVDPQDLRSTAEHLADVSARMKQVMSSLNSKLAAEGAPWGDDSTGHAFADGADGYLAQVDDVNGSVKAKTDLLDQYADNLRKIADTFEQSDGQ